MPISIELAQAVLSNVLYNPKKRQVTPERIAKAVSDYYSVPMDVLQGQKRDKAIVMPRQIAMFLMREETDVSLLRIGAELGGRDHSTVLHACDKITREVADQRRAAPRDRRGPRADLRRLRPPRCDPGGRGPAPVRRRARVDPGPFGGQPAVSRGQRPARCGHRAPPAWTAGPARQSWTAPRRSSTVRPTVHSPDRRRLVHAPGPRRPRSRRARPSAAVHALHTMTTVMTE